MIYDDFSIISARSSVSVCCQLQTQFMVFEIIVEYSMNTISSERKRHFNMYVPVYINNKLLFGTE